jgi:hypothetical protein
MMAVCGRCGQSITGPYLMRDIPTGHIAVPGGGNAIQYTTKPVHETCYNTYVNDVKNKKNTMATWVWSILLIVLAVIFLLGYWFIHSMSQ